MTSVNDLHPKAMDLAENALILRSRGEFSFARSLFLEALNYERQAALLLDLNKESEPSRSVLFRSAASLAYNGEDYKEAERLIAQGLAGYPPADVRDELLNLLEDITFMRHLELKGLTLDSSQLLMTISGDATAHGRALVNQLLGRVEKINTVFYRTVSRMKGLPFTESIDKKIREHFGLYINAFVARSFGISLQVGSVDPQSKLFPEMVEEETVDPGKVIEEVLECFRVLDGFHPETLRSRFPDDTYFENFVGLAKQIAPDGEDIKLVGFNYFANGEEHPVALRRNKEQLKQAPELKNSDSFEGEVESQLNGVLNFASTPTKRGKFGTVHLTDPETGVEHRIRVPISLMKDVVQPYYNEPVSVLISRKEGKLYLREVMPAK